MGRDFGWALASVLSAGFAGLGRASAADMAVKARPIAPPVWTWTGSYVGINGGLIESNNNTLTNVGTDTGNGGLGSAINLGLIPIALTGFRNSGGMVGGSAGYNWQVNPNWVVGIEGDIDWVSEKRTFNTGFITVPGAVPVATAYSRELDWLGTLRGRVGYAVAPSLLVYGDGRPCGRTSPDLQSVYLSDMRTSGLYRDQHHQHQYQHCSGLDGRRGRRVEICAGLEREGRVPLR